MKIISEKSISNFEAWSGAVDTKNKIINANMENEFDAMIEELYPDGIDETALNDLLWFESDWVLSSLGISGIDEEEEQEDENDD